VIRIKEYIPDNYYLYEFYEREQERLKRIHNRQEYEEDIENNDDRKEMIE
jgi:hypothetical protein